MHSIERSLFVHTSYPCYDIDMRELANTDSIDRNACTSGRLLAFGSARTIALSAAKNMGMSNCSRGADEETPDEVFTWGETALEVVGNPGAG